MDIAEQAAGRVGANGDEAEVKGTAVCADLGEGGTGGEVGVGGAVVVCGSGDGGRDGAVAGVACEVEVCAAGGDAPACPEGFALVEGGAGADVLAGEGADGGGWGGVVWGGGESGGGGGWDGFQGDLSTLPPVQLGNLVNPTSFKPDLVTQGSEIVSSRELLLQALNSGIAQVVVVIMANHHSIDKGQVLDFTRRGRIALQALGVEGRAAVLEHGVEEDAQATGEFNIVTCMAQPGGTQFGGISRGVEAWGAYGHGRRRGIGCMRLAGEFSPRQNCVLVAIACFSKSHLHLRWERHGGRR